MPPYCSGMGPPRNPTGAIFLRTSAGNFSARSRSRAPGAISRSAKSRASLRIDSCSGVRSKSMRVEANRSAVRSADGHPSLRLGERHKSVLRVEPVRVACREEEVAQTLELRVAHHRVHQQPRHALTAMRRQHEDVAEPGEGRLVGDDARVARERLALVRDEREAVVDGALERIARHALRPVRVQREESVDGVTIGADELRHYAVPTHAADFSEHTCVQIRRATERDADPLARVLRESFAEFERLYTRAGYAATTPDADVLRVRLSEGPTWVAEERGEIIGTVS